MSEASRLFLSLSGVRLADLLDIAIVAGFCYLAISWFRRARSRFVLMGLGATAALYALATVLELTLTLLIFQALITVALLALVVIFQEEIRRVFELIATGAPLRLRAVSSPDSISLVVRSVTALAAKKTGVLLVFRGREPLERHLSKGVPLHGDLSEQLLDSLFDSSSAGHDGAVIVEGNRITRFGVHLPLGGAEDSRRGLRHSAARGVSERSDAFVIVVSEERGIISVARRGVLREVSASELEHELAAFTAEIAPRAPRPRLRSVIFSSLGEKALALVLAAAAWFLVFSEQNERVSQSFVVPIEYRLMSPEWRLEPPDPREARVVLTGSNRAFQKLDPSSLAVSIDASGVGPGAQVRTLTDQDVQAPRGLDVLSITPRDVTVVATELIDMEMAVQPRTTGQVAEDVILQRVRVQPSKVRVRVPKAAVGQIGAVQTEPIDLEGLAETRAFRIGLVLPPKAQLPEDAPAEVEVTVQVASRPPRPPRLPASEGPDPVPMDASQ